MDALIVLSVSVVIVLISIAFIRKKTNSEVESEEFYEIEEEKKQKELEDWQNSMNDLRELVRDGKERFFEYFHLAATGNFTGMPFDMTKFITTEKLKIRIDFDETSRELRIALLRRNVEITSEEDVDLETEARYYALQACEDCYWVVSTLVILISENFDFPDDTTYADFDESLLDDIEDDNYLEGDQEKQAMMIEKMQAELNQKKNLLAREILHKGRIEYNINEEYQDIFGENKIKEIKIWLFDKSETFSQIWDDILKADPNLTMRSDEFPQFIQRTSIEMRDSIVDTIQIPGFTPKGDLKKGSVYILINSSLKNLVKIGKTTRSPEDRAKEISQGTGVPTEYMVAYSEEVKDCDLVEKLVHERLRPFRVNDNREFFQISVKEAIRTIRDIIKEKSM